MKRIVVVLLVLLLAGGLFAQEGEKKSDDKLAFKYGGMLYIYNKRFDKVSGGDPIAYWETRVRQYFTFGNKNYGVVTKFEIDPTWGSGEGSNNVKVGADMKGELQIKNAYLYFKMPNMPLKVKAGIHFHMSPGMFMFADDVGGISVNYKTESFELNAIYCKMGEYTNTIKLDDAEMAGITLSLKAGSLKLTPGLYYYYKGAGADTGAVTGVYSALNYRGIYTRNAFIPQVGVEYKSDSLKASLVAAYGFGKIKDAGTGDASGLGIDLKLNYKLGSSLSVGFMATYISGDDSGTGNEFESFAQFMPGLVQGIGVRLIGASVFLQGGLTANPEEAIGASSVYSYGLMMFGANVCLTAGKFKFKAVAAFLASAEEYAAGSSTYGIEADFFVDYKLYKNLKLQVEASFFKPNSDYQGSLPDICSLFLVGTTFKW